MGTSSHVSGAEHATAITTSDLAARIVAMSRRPKNMGAAVSDDVVSLAMGEPSEPTPRPVVEAAISALRAGRTRYAPLTGLPALQQAIADHLEAHHGRSFPLDTIVCTHGASAGLAATILATVNPGDRIVIPEPTYSLYADHAAMLGAEVDWIANTANGSPDLDAIEASLPGARMIILCSPNNPTGTVIEQDALRRISDAAAAAGALMVCDEAYAAIVFDDKPFPCVLDLEPAAHIICAKTFSKAYAMTGWRLGYIVAAPEIATAINLVHRTLNGALSTFIQDAGVVALDTPGTHLEELTAAYQSRRDMVVDTLAGLPGVRILPAQGAFYAFIYVDNGPASDELVGRCAEAGVIVRSGTEFGPSGAGAFRISFATDPDSLRIGLDRISSVLAAYAGSRS